MIRKQFLLITMLTLGFTTLSLNLAYADNEIFDEPKEQIVAQQEQEETEQVDIEQLLEINEQQAEIQEQEQEQDKEEKQAEQVAPADATKADKLISIAKSKLGSPYVYGSTGPSSFDCSGYTSYVFRQIGISLPRVASSQAYGAKKVAKSNLQKGDLVFFNTFGGISHVGIYMENGNFIHASSYGRGVTISNINDSYYGPRYVTAARYL